MAAAFASTLFSSASSLVGRTAISSNYILASSLPSSSAPIPAPRTIGVWQVESATHGTSGKMVSVWTCEKSKLMSSSRNERVGARESAKRLEKILQVLRKEVTSLSRLRHPGILEIREAMEETRSVLVFATERVTGSLTDSIAELIKAEDSSRRNQHRSLTTINDLSLDEVEISKGFHQVGSALEFLHHQAKLLHGNITPECIIVNAKGDWKLSGFGLAIDLFDEEGAPARWTFPESDRAVPSTCRRNYDYIAPEWILDEAAPSPAMDLYSLGCVLHSVYTKSGPPFLNRHSLQNARTNIEDGLSRGLIRASWRNLSSEVQTVLTQLITRYPSARLTTKDFLSHEYFSSLLVSTLRFLEMDSFSSQTVESQAKFLRGLTNILPQFSAKVCQRKILPSLLEATRQSSIIPFLLPNIFSIAMAMDAMSFRSDVLPHIKPLFELSDPPQVIVVLLDTIPLFVEKCTGSTFRDEIMPLVYNALQSNNNLVVEKVLSVVPSLAETLDYTTVKSTLFPKITSVFAKTTQLSIKVSTLICIHAFASMLDKHYLTEQVIPLLSKIKTREPAVLLAALSVFELLGKKCDVSTCATLILPLLWTFSISPLLTPDQFTRFIVIIRATGQRVEVEHAQSLREIRRIEETSSRSVTRVGDFTNGGDIVGPDDFAQLVRGARAKETAEINWDIPLPSTRTVPLSTYSPSLAALSRPTNSSRSFAHPTASISTQSSNSISLIPSVSSLSTIETPRSDLRTTLASNKPNYNISADLFKTPALLPSNPSYPSLSPSIVPPHPASSTSSNSKVNGSAVKPVWNVLPPSASSLNVGRVLQPTRAVKEGGQSGFGDWGDLDPLG